MSKLTTIFVFSVKTLVKPRETYSRDSQMKTPKTLSPTPRFPTVQSSSNMPIEDPDASLGEFNSCS